MWSSIFQASERTQRLFLVIIGLVFFGIGVVAAFHEISVALAFCGFGSILICAGLFLTGEWLKRFLITLFALAVAGVFAGRYFSIDKS